MTRHVGWAGAGVAGRRRQPSRCRRATPVRSPPVSDRDELLAAIKAKAIVRGDFVLSSGQRADWYVDLRRILLDGRLAPQAGRVMLDLTADLAYDAVGGLTMGADRVVAQVRGQVEHDPSGQRRHPSVQQDPAQVHVEPGALP